VERDLPGDGVDRDDVVGPRRVARRVVVLLRVAERYTGTGSPKAATKTCPAPNANVVGVGIPRATTATACPFTAVGGGGGPAGAPA
jgi:hypothetical protein